MCEVFELQCGRLTIKQPKSGISLDLSVSTKLQHDGNHAAEPDLQNGLSAEQLREVWISRGNGLQLVIDLYENLELGADQTELLSPWTRDLIADQLVNAEFWSQLGLRASDITGGSKYMSNIQGGGTERDDNQHDRNSIALSLVHKRESHPQALGKSVYKLCYGIPPADVKPPIGIPIVEMLEVRLHIVFSRIPSSKQQLRQRKNEELGNSLIEIPRPFDGATQEPGSTCDESIWMDDEEASDFFEEMDSGYESIMNSQDSVVTQIYTTVEVPAGLQLSLYEKNAISPTFSAKDAMLLDEETQPYLYDHATFIPYTAEVQPWQHISTDRHNSGVVMHSLPPLEPATGQRDETIVRLVDAALRLSMHATPTRLVAGLKRLNEDQFPIRLSQFAPFLWSPGYADAVSTRAALIPTIARVFSHGVYKNARSSSLRAKIDALADKYQFALQSDGNAERQDDSRSTGVTPGEDELERLRQVTCDSGRSHRFQALSAELWKVIRRGLFKPDAARSLKPLSFEGASQRERGMTRQGRFASSTGYDFDIMYDSDDIDGDIWDEDPDENLLDFQNGYSSEEKMLLDESDD